MMALIAQNMAPIMFVSLILFLLYGYPVAFALAANGLLFFAVGVWLAPLSEGAITLDWNLLRALPERFFGGVMANETLLAVPFFTFMGILLEKSGMAEDLLDTIGQLFGPVRGGLAYAVIIVGALLAATTGVVAASVIAMGLISLPIMLRYGYDRRLASGVIAASGTLAQIIPPSLVLIVLADQLGKSVGDMYKGALIPGLLLTGFYMLYVFVMSLIRPSAVPALPPEARKLGSGVLSLVVVLAVGVGITLLAHRELYDRMGNNADILGAVVGVLVVYFIALFDKEGWRFLIKLAVGLVAAALGWLSFEHELVANPLRAAMPGIGIGGDIINLLVSFFGALGAWSLAMKALGRVVDFRWQEGHGIGLMSRLAQQVVIVLIPPLALVFLVLGTIFLGIATPTEGGAMGAVGALLLAAAKRRLNMEVLRGALLATTRLSAFVMFILIGARVFSLTFYGVNGHAWVEHLLTSLPGGEYGFLIAVSVLVFLLAFFLDFFELAFIIVPLLAPAAQTLGIDLIWFGVLLGINMQTSFMHPPFGFALFFLRSVAPNSPYLDRITGQRIAPVTTGQIYWGAVPFLVIQIVMIGVVMAFPGLVMHYKGPPIDTSQVEFRIPSSGGGAGGFGGFGGFTPPAGGVAPGGFQAAPAPNFGAPAPAAPGGFQPAPVPGFGAPAPATAPGGFQPAPAPGFGAPAPEAGAPPAGFQPAPAPNFGAPVPAD